MVITGSLSERLTADFYHWERRGRGWDVWNYPVSLEPPFVPFGFHSLRTSVLAPVPDNGRKETFLSSISSELQKILCGSGDPSDRLLHTDTEEEPLPVSFETGSALKEIRVILPPDEKVSTAYAEQLILNIGSVGRPVGYEILGTNNSVITRFTCSEADLPHMMKQLRAYFPDAAYEVGDNTLEGLTGPQYHSVVLDFGLSEEFMRPIRTPANFDPDPLTGAIGALEDLREEEIGLIQVLFQAADNPWAESVIRSVTGNDGSSFFADAPEMLPLTREKIGSPLFAAVVRVVARSSSEKGSWEIARSLSSTLNILANPGSNELIPLNNDGYSDSVHLDDVVHRRTHRSGMILNSKELLNLVHLPSISVRSPKFRGIHKKTKEAPKSSEGHRFVLGDNIHQNRTVPVSLSTEQRLRHIHVVGSTGTGKSTLLLNMILQDMEQGSGCAVFDPHGDLIDRVLELVPEERMEDLVLFDPADTDYPVGFNILEARSEMEKNVLSSDLVALFRRFSTSWGDQMTAVLGNAVSAFLESPKGGNLLELRRFLIEKEYREEYLKSVVDAEIVYFWQKQFPVLRGMALSSILTRLDIFLRPKIIRHIVGRRNGLDCNEIINTKKVFLVKLAQGLIGEENAHLLGSLLVSKLHQATMGRQAKESSARDPFYIYIDEFQHFVTPSMASVLESGRKFGVGLTVSHQQLKQLVDADNQLANSLITNPVTRICFRLGDFDAERLEGGFSYFNATDLENLGVGEAVVRVERSEQDFNLRTYNLPRVDPAAGTLLRERIHVITRERYGKPTVDTEALIPDNKIETIPATAVELKEKISHQNLRDRGVEPESKQSLLPEEIFAPPSDVAVAKSLSQHRYLQTLIKKMAEQRGYRAIIEEPTPDGKGRVDVGMERNGKRIAVEISVTTGDIHELHNVEKCLNANYDSVIVCSPERKNLEGIRRRADEKLSKEAREKVYLFEPEELPSFLDLQVINELPREARVKGYRVKVQYQAISETDKKKKQKEVARVIAESMRRIKAKP